MLIAAGLILASNIYSMINYANEGAIIGSIIMNICYFILLGVQTEIVLRLIRQHRAQKRIEQEITQTNQRTEVVVAITPLRAVAPVRPIATTTIVSTFGTETGQSVVLESGALYPVVSSGDQGYARTTSNLYPTIPHLGQIVLTTSSAPSELYDVPPEVTVTTVYHQNRANDEVQYDIPPPLADDQEEPVHGRPESQALLILPRFFHAVKSFMMLLQEKIQIA